MDNRDKKKKELKSLDDQSQGEEDKILTKINEVLKQVNGTRDGLTTEEAQRRLIEFGPNALPESHSNPFLKFLGFMWNPLSWVMETAALISIILLDYVDFGLIIALLLVNSTIAYWEETSSSNAIAELQKQLAPTTKCLRDGEIVKDFASRDLVPGDVVLIRLGDLIPADSVLLDDHGDGLLVDQAALTGESLPVDKFPGDGVYAGSIVKKGEIRAVVQSTGLNSFFGRTATLVNDSEGDSGHFQKVLSSVGWFCICVISVVLVIELAVEFGGKAKPCDGVGEGSCATLANAMVLIVGGVPIAMPTVLSVTMAIGASQLAKKKAIVSHLTAIEELAGMDILCSDKTGTLTLNDLQLAKPFCFIDGVTPEDVIFAAALCCKPENGDHIDCAIVEYLSEEQEELREQYDCIHYEPFDPVSKRTFAHLRDPQGKSIWTLKGAPQIVLKDASNFEEVAKRVNKAILKLANRGYRALGVSRSLNGKEWEMIGIIPLLDPPRADTKSTIERAQKLGIHIKMITGDQIPIARETARLLGMDTNIIRSGVLNMTKHQIQKTYHTNLNEIVEAADGFAEVFPEDKHAIVKRLQKLGHCVGMTGDGVNDAPALKKANIGIAVANATDAARAASDIVLLSPGLSEIIDAIMGSRKIFQRMKNYCMYSISCTVRIVLTFGILTMAYDWYFPTVAIVIIAILNDGTMMTLSKDRVKPSVVPDVWDLRAIFTISIFLGMWLTASTLVLFAVLNETDFFERSFGLDKLTADQQRGFIYLQVSVSGLATIFVTRSQGFSFRERPAHIVSIAFVLAQTVASFIGAYGLGGFPFTGVSNMEGGGWGYVLVAWVWCLIWYIPMDFIKFGVRRLLRGNFNLFRMNVAVARRPAARKRQAMAPGPADYDVDV